MDLLRRFLGGASTPNTPPERVRLTTVIFDRSAHVVDVVGESFRQDVLENLGGGRVQEGVARPDHVAELMADPANPKDPMAVEVQLDGRLVGYLARPDARAYHPVLDRLAAHGYSMGCQALLTGGWDRGDDRGSIGVRLLVGSPATLWRELDGMLGAAAMPGSLSADDGPPQILVATTSVPSALAGKRVCFTGPSRFTFKGSELSRDMQELLAAQHGMIVLPRVTKALDILVVAHPEVVTGKAAKALTYGTTIVDEAEFWRVLGVVLDP